MAYNVSNRYREIVYNEEKLYTCSLVINGNVISPSQIAEIKLSRPIIDDTQDAFYIGTFISDKLEIKFKNINEIDVKSGYEVNFSISLNVDGTLEETPFQTFYIDTLDENYQKSNEISCFDSSIKFESAINTPYEQVLTYNYTGKNIFNPDKITINSDLDLTDGSTSDNGSYNTSGYTVVEFSEDYVFSNVTPTKVCYYNSNLEFISSEEPQTSVITTPATARFLKFSYSNSNELENPQLELGDTATSYEEFDPSRETWSITLQNLLIWTCNRYNVTLGTYPNINRNVLTGNWDSTVSGKQYISWLAEMFGGNAKINRNNELCIYPLKSTPVVTINALRSKSLEVGEKYYLSQVSYVDATRNQTYTLPDHESENGNTLFIRQDNIFVPNGESNTENTAIENIFNLNSGYVCYSLTNENFADFSLDPWDNLTLTAGEISYIVPNNSEIAFNGSGMVKIDTQIPTKQQEVTTNIMKSDTEESIRKVWSTIDQLNGQIELGASNITQLTKKTTNDYETLSDRIDGFPTETQITENVLRVLPDMTQFAITEQLENGDVSVGKVKTENVIIDTTGINVYKTDGNTQNPKIISNTATLFNEDGMKVSNVSNGQKGSTVLYSGYIEADNTELSDYVGQTIVYTENLVCKTYANFGKYSRIEDYKDVDNIEKTGMFPLR